jgi:hypothetical protein
MHSLSRWCYVKTWWCGSTRTSRPCLIGLICQICCASGIRTDEAYYGRIVRESTFQVTMVFCSFGPAGRLLGPATVRIREASTYTSVFDGIVRVSGDQLSVIVAPRSGIIESIENTTVMAYNHLVSICTPLEDIYHSSAVHACCDSHVTSLKTSIPFEMRFINSH